MGKEVGEKILQSIQVDALLLTSAANMRFVTGFTGEGYVYLSQKQCIVVTDSRYTIAAKMECPNCTVFEWGKEEYYSFLVTAMKEDKVSSLGIEDEEMTVAFWKRLEKKCKAENLEKVKFKPLGKQVSDFRGIKTEEEIDCIKKAEAIGDKAFERILTKLKVGMAEKEVAAWLEFFMKEEGADGLSFDTIAASGIHSAMPHAVPTEKKLQEGDFLTMDFGCKYKGYCSDMTRTVVIGKASKEQKKVYETVLKAQKTALKGIHPGITGKEADSLARNVIEEAGYGKYFGHSLGHSVGLEIHEGPNFSPKEERVLEPGMVITVEPGIYIKDFGGVRIEDVVVITENGCENITHSPKELIEIES